MAASTIQAFVLEYNYPIPGQAATDQPLDNPFFMFHQDSGNFETLSSNIHNTGADIQGFLYTPQFAANDVCFNVSAPYIPANITTVDKIPSSNEFPRVAFVPWVNNTKCMLKYLGVANGDSARALVTYLPDRKNLGDYKAAAAPNITDPAWDLGDGDAWKNNFGFPVYALNSNDGSLVMSELSNYSSDISTVQYGATLVQKFGPSATARLYMQAAVYSYSQLPSLWVFLLIVVAVLIGVLLVASLAMRIVHRRRRRELARMVADGRVSLEGLGISRVKVTPEIVNKMPLYIFVKHGDLPGKAHAPPVEEADTANGDAAAGSNSAGSSESKKKPQTGWRAVSAGIFDRKPHPSSRPGAKLPGILEEKPVSFPQDTCVICLDDFENHVTAVRWLPCGHAFHPACIDPLLLEYSALCPTCKASVLPKDFMPEITNNMVRRERLMRRIRDLEAREHLQDQRVRQAGGPAHFRGMARFIPRTTNADAATGAGSGSGGAATGPGAGTNATPATSNTPAIELQIVNADSEGQSSSRPEQVQRNASQVSGLDPAARRPENVSREEWARRRAGELVGATETVEQAEQREMARLPAWRRVLGPVFPNLRS